MTTEEQLQKADEVIRSLTKERDKYRNMYKEMFFKNSRLQNELHNIGIKAARCTGDPADALNPNKALEVIQEQMIRLSAVSAVVKCFIQNSELLWDDGDTAYILDTLRNIQTKHVLKDEHILRMQR